MQISGIPRSPLVASPQSHRSPAPIARGAAQAARRGLDPLVAVNVAVAEQQAPPLHVAPASVHRWPRVLLTIEPAKKTPPPSAYARRRRRGRGARARTPAARQRARTARL